MVPGEKLPKDPPLDPDGHVEISLAKAPNVTLPVANFSMASSTASSVFTNM
eukprot:CAMPEP_0184865416 /NCGR_PEP_ID=MMETSP0580-20130426/18022_1 /TAXON_ID=1118495 /ORGANISM="Dactyliosolen fragilissimus" /LENGTH=50 /DNA_ID=CAMNT_0027364615 /DNA_START=273 /DNA_END=425 /DNA_ORIENTATION=+